MCRAQLRSSVFKAIHREKNSIKNDKAVNFFKKSNEGYSYILIITI